MPKYQNYLIPKEVKYICPPPKVSMAKRKGPTPTKSPEKLFFEINNKGPLMNRNLIEPSNFHIPIDNLNKNKVFYSPTKENNNNIGSYHKKILENHKIVVNKQKYDNNDRRKSVPVNNGKHFNYLMDKNERVSGVSPIQYKEIKTTYVINFLFFIFS